ncbi:MAG: hypothetical protein OEV42_17385 [Deltaproteobacteria bacterium]|nr:hypothetical protein [Deltaproteobacteria bacterium]
MDAINRIDKQIELELMTSSVYRKLEEYTEDEEVRRLWHTLGIHEEYHAAALERLKKTLNEEELEKEASTLDVDNIETLLSAYRVFLEEIAPGLSVKRAFEIAIFMEFSELNSLFFHSVGKGGQDNSPYIHSMGEGTKSHLLTLYRGIRKHIGKDEDLSYRSKFEEIGLVDRL